MSVPRLVQVMRKDQGRRFTDQKGLRKMFPLLPGSHLEMTDPILEFVKSTCRVLSIDANVAEEVRKATRKRCFP